MDEYLRRTLKAKLNNDRFNHCHSDTIQNELLVIIFSKITDQILQLVKDAKYFVIALTYQRKSKCLLFYGS